MKKFFTLIVSTFTVLLVSMPSWADDVDIYIRQISGISQGKRPNVLFMMDNSGSMLFPIRDENGKPMGETRIDVLKQALLKMITDVNNVNLGLARFAYLSEARDAVNAPIMFPVVYVDANASEIPGEAKNSIIDLSVGVANSEDDAEENTGSGRMILNRKSLQMVQLKTNDDFKGIKIEKFIDNNKTQVAVQWLGNVRKLNGLGNKDKGKVSLGESPVWLGADHEEVVDKNRGDGLLALRFTGLAIPVGAKIEKAQVEFTSDQDYPNENDQDNLKIIVSGAADDGGTGDPSGKDLKKDPNYLTSSFSKTTINKVEWNLEESLGQGQGYVTEDLSAVLQEIVKRPAKKDDNGQEIPGTGWQEGNSVVLLFQAAPDSPPGAKGFAAGLSDPLSPPPLLRLSWTIEKATAIAKSGKVSSKKGTSENEMAIEYGNKVYRNDGYLGYKPNAKSGGTGVDQKAALDAAKAELAKAELNLAEATAKLRDLKQAKGVKKDLLASVADAQSKAQTLDSTVKNNSKLDLDGAKATVTTANEAVAAAKQNLENLKQQREAAKAALQGAQAKLVADAQAAVDAAQAAVDAAQTTVDNALAKVTDAQAKVTEAQTKVTETQAKVTEAQTKATEPQAKATEAQSKVKAAQDAQKAAQDAQKAAQAAQKTAQAAQKAADSAQKAAAKAAAACNKPKNKPTNCDELAAALQAANDALQAANNELAARQAEFSQLDLNLQTAQQALKAAQDELTAAQAELTAAQTDLKTAQTDLKTAQAELKTAQQDKTAQNELTAAQKALTTAQKALTTAQKTLATEQDKLAKDAPTKDLDKQITMAEKAVATAEANAQKVDKAQQGAAVVLDAIQAVLTATQSLADAVQGGQISSETNIDADLSTAATALENAQTKLKELNVGFKELVSAQTLLTTLQTIWQSAPDLVAAQAKVTELQKVVDEKTKVVNDLKNNKKPTGGGSTTGAATKTPVMTGIRFAEVSIPKGASILEAYLTLTHQSTPDELSQARSAKLNLIIHGEKSVAPKDFKEDPNLSKRPQTKASAEWSELPDYTEGLPFKTDDKTSKDLASILQEIVNQDDWQNKNSMVFIFENQDSNPEGFRRFVGMTDTGEKVTPDTTKFSNLPTLTVKYSVGLGGGGVAGGDSDQQLIGLRFANVDIPQGAKVVGASIDFRSDAVVNEPPANLLIQAQDNPKADSFSNETKDISSRKLLPNGVVWEVPAWEKGLLYTTPDLSELVQKLVQNKDWCGGDGSIAFVISAADENSKPFRLAKSFDNAPQLAPVLNVEYDLKSIPQKTCMQQNYSGQVSFEIDDAEETISGNEDGNVYVKNKSLELGQKGDESRLVGFRFREIPLSKGAKVLKASLTLTALNNGKGDKNKFTVTGELSPDSAPFSQTQMNLSKRPRTKTGVTWEINDKWERGRAYTSPDLSEVIKALINQNGWDTYNNLTLFIEGNIQRDAFAYEAAARSAAVLRIQVEGFLGEGGKNAITARNRLRKITKNMDIPASATPLVDSLYESALYYRGDDVELGKSRHELPEYLVSHPGTYTGGELRRPTSCSIARPFAPECAPEKIMGPARYTSPIVSPCQSNHIVLLTDGLATRNYAFDEIFEMIKSQLKDKDGKLRKECYKEFTDPENPDGDPIKLEKAEKCGLDLAEFLQNTDNSSKLKGDQKVVVHTIGFQLGTAWKQLYKDENGKNVSEDDNGALVYDDGSKVPKGTKLTPAGYQEDSDETKKNEHAVKFLKALAQRGGGKFYAAKSVNDLVNAFNAILGDAITKSTTFAAPGVSVNRFNNLFSNEGIYYSVFKPTRQPRWNGNIKKYQICQGTDGNCTPPELIDVNKQPAVEIKGGSAVIKATARSFWSDTVDGNRIANGGAGSKVPDSSERRIFTYLGDAQPGQNHNISIDTEDNAIQPSNQALLDALKGDGDLEEAERLKIIDWIRGKNVNNEKNPESSSDKPEADRWKIADPLHATPGMVTYGGTEEAPIFKLFVGTNDGLMHMLDETTGVEDWAFLPKELLSKQKDLMDNAEGGEHIYGIDNTPTFWIYDANEDVKINPAEGDFVKMYVSMRRGGRNIYALDVTGTSDSPGNPPKLMWVIKGGDPGFEKLGETWSRPKFTVVSFNGKRMGVLLFGGGYHDSQDEQFSTTEDKAGGGNAIFMVDAETGQRLWWASNKGADLNLLDMKYPIPSDLTVRDTDNDGNMDRIFVGDLGGQVWRIDIGFLANGGSAVGIPLAMISEDSPKEQRRFFFPPEVVRVKDIEYSQIPTYDLVLIASGNRTQPLRTEPLKPDVHDRIFAFRDPQLEPLVDSSSFEPIKMDKMFDATSNVLQSGSEGSKIQAQKDLKDSRGWYVNLQEKPPNGDWIGEKGLASPFILDGKAFLTTYVPPKEGENECDPTVGESKLYVLDILNATAALDLNNDGKIDEKDRSKGVGEGIVPPPPILDPKPKPKDGESSEVVVPLDGAFPAGTSYRKSKSPSRVFWLQK